MTDYLPLHDDAASFTRIASAVLATGQLVRVSGSGTVAPVTAASGDWLGVAGFDADIGAAVTIYAGGVQRLTAAATITAGQLLQGAAGGQVAPFTDGTAEANIVGVALSSAVSGALVEVRPTR